MGARMRRRPTVRLIGPDADPVRAEEGSGASGNDPLAPDGRNAVGPTVRSLGWSRSRDSWGPWRFLGSRCQWLIVRTRQPAPPPR